MFLRLLAAGLALSFLAVSAIAAPDRYRLDPAGSEVVFHFRVEGVSQSGLMPITSADIRLDLADLSASSVEVVLHAHAAVTGAQFITNSLKGAEMLATAEHPKIQFRSTQVTGDPGGATVTGDLTIRGVTQRIALNAVLTPAVTAATSANNQLTVELTGAISRAAFGMTGYRGLVSDLIGLQITAVLEK